MGERSALTVATALYRTVSERGLSALAGRARRRDPDLARAVVAMTGRAGATMFSIRDTAMDAAWIDLYWIPLGAGGHCVRWNGRAYERLIAAREHRRPLDLVHSALKISAQGTTYAVEMGPVWNVATAQRGVVCEGPVAARSLGRLRAFRYEVRCWPEGDIPDLNEALGPPHRVSEDPAQVAAALHTIPQVPPLTWGRDQLRTGDMWNSNSLVSWTLARTGHDMHAVAPPRGTRAPGWRAGLVLAELQGDVRLPAFS